MYNTHLVIPGLLENICPSSVYSYIMNMITHSPIIARLDPVRVCQHPLHAVRRHTHRPRELRGQQPQHPEEGALQEEDVPQGCSLLDRRVNKVSRIILTRPRNQTAACCQRAAEVSSHMHRKVERNRPQKVYCVSVLSPCSFLDRGQIFCPLTLFGDFPNYNSKSRVTM